MPSEAEVERWRRAIEAQPALYRLPAYGEQWMTPERAARYFAQWAADERTGAASPALCRRCGRLLTTMLIIRPGQQLHAGCEPTPYWPSPADVPIVVAPTRLLITGSRTWNDEQAVKDALRPWWHRGTTVLVHGACPRGADAIADRLWSGAGGSVEAHPADWATYGKAAGHRRNAGMVALGADHCIAFLRTDTPSPGTRGCIELAQRAGIPTTIISRP